MAGTAAGQHRDVEVERDGIRLHVQVDGDGPASLVLVHGWLSTGAVFRRQAEALAPRARVVRPDVRGFGRSDQPSDGCTVSDLVDDVLAVLDEAADGPVVLAGWSMGATIAVHVAVRHPDRVARLVLLDPTPQLVAGDGWDDAIPPESAQGLAGLLQQDYEAGARAFLGDVLNAPGEEVFLDELLEEARTTTAQAAGTTLEPTGGARHQEVFSQVRHPTLVVVGEHDRICPPAAARWTAENVPGARLHVVEGAGHAPFLAGADEVTGLLAQELDALS